MWISPCDGDGEVNVLGYNKVELAVRVDLFGSCYTSRKGSHACSVT